MKLLMTKNKKIITIACIGSGLLQLDQLHPFQGNLKTLTEANYQKCKASILKLSFSEPFSVWEDPLTGKTFILNGHMRLKTLIRMREEGYYIPPLPVTYIDCTDEAQAKEKVLAFTSQFGEMYQENLIDFCQDAELDFDEILENYRFPEITFITEEGISSDNNDEDGVETEDEAIDDAKKTTIKVKVPHEDRDECIKKIKQVLSEIEGVDIL